MTNPIRRLPFSGTAGKSTCEVAAVPMTWEHVDFWHENVQPKIDGQYIKANELEFGADPRTEIRADVGWNWSIYFWLAKRWNTVRPHAGPEQRAVAWCLVALDGQGMQLPIGMLTAVPAYASPFPNDNAELGFVWYLSDAPMEHYVHRKMPRVSSVAQALLDIAIQTRLELINSAAIFLHADPAGGTKLLKFYKDKCGMVCLQEDKRISLVRSVRAGQYFALTHAQGEAFAGKFDPLRIL
ncbi:hypothetical protein K6W76_30355 [Burkholderia anthina]|uniref:hypothetical protein n=1 Tax=Burkholderia anthina TaxID=179879 RepID=UPI00158C9051|nr:hypothetical protein [Burkholderia anthina]MBY4870750.1 hypothetical protein [Burkholderia anthina]